MSDDPGRWLDQADLDPDVRRALTAGREEAPSDAQLSSLAARLGPLLGPGGGPGGSDGGGGGGGTAAAGGGASLAAKAMGGLMAAVAVTGVGLFMAVPERVSSPVHETAPAVSEAEPEAPREVPETIPEGLDAPPEVVAPEPRPAPPPALETDPAAELALIRQAQSALASSPREALAHTVSHRRRFGDGALAQEREVVAIDALTRLDRVPQARARADRFRSRWPRSAHVRRVDVLVPPE
ncbi:MAG: hypothetical protein AB8I08_04400 [Sandaracinaceae bacterium]